MAEAAKVFWERVLAEINDHGFFKQVEHRRFAARGARVSSKLNAWGNGRRHAAGTASHGWDDRDEELPLTDTVWPGSLSRQTRMLVMLALLPACLIGILIAVGSLLLAGVW